MMVIDFAPANHHRVPVAVHRGPSALRAFIDGMFSASPVFAGDPPHPHGAQLAEYVSALRRVQHYFAAGWALKHQQRGPFIPEGGNYRHHGNTYLVSTKCVTDLRRYF